jgi:23S rRNA pseudouridine1911/1915/1917 synthase
MQEQRETYKVRFVNRLDMDTSGVMILAKNAFSHHALMLQMKEDQMVKTYRVFVWGQVKASRGTIDAPIYRQQDLPENEPPLRIVDSRGKAAVSHYEVESVYPEASLVKITLETGRTHQIRVHMKHLGYPVIGDDFYEPSQPRLIGRQALHAAETSFIQPRFGNRISITAGFPEDLLQLEQLLKSGPHNR